MDNLKNTFLERMPAAEMEENLVTEADAGLSNRRYAISESDADKKQILNAQEPLLTEQHFFTLQLTCCAMAASARKQMTAISTPSRAERWRDSNAFTHLNP